MRDRGVRARRGLLTVAELVAALLTLPQEATVMLEGSDAFEFATGAVVVDAAVRKSAEPRCGTEVLEDGDVLIRSEVDW